MTPTVTAAPDRRLTDAQRALAESSWPEALGIARRFERRYAFAEVDFQGAVALGLCRAARGFRGGRGATFRTYAARRMKGACLDALRAERLKGFGRAVGYEGAPRVVSLYEAADRRGDPATHADLAIADEAPVGAELESVEAIRAIAARLPARMAELVLDRFVPRGNDGSTTEAQRHRGGGREEAPEW